MQARKRPRFVHAPGPVRRLVPGYELGIDFDDLRSTGASAAFTP
jgi:hypothetical protein